MSEFNEGVGEVAAAFDIETVKRLIKEEDVGLLCQGAGDEGALLLTAGELVDLTIGNFTKVHGRDGFLGLGSVDISKAFEVPKVRKTPHRNDVTDANGEVSLVTINLGKIGDLPPGVGDGLLAPLNGAGLLFQEPGEEFDESAFTGAVRAEKSEALTAMN